jgi:hypothetical protein
VNNKIYVGVHKTSDLNDGYMGSGKVIKDAINKYGIDNFKKDILEYFEDSESMYAREKEIVTDEFLLREDVYNLRRGGTGGFDYINKSPQKITENRINGYASTGLSLSGRKNPEFSERLKTYHKDGRLSGTYFGTDRMKYVIELARTDEARKKHKESLRKISHQVGCKNSQFGTCWISHEIIGSKKCKVSELPLFIEQGWYKGRNLFK